ncbi:threonine synthase [Ideonella sp. 4Y11]|uniref:Threonine synthase n=1 Tax=Ideonella aquatica TaxID=2824119 RepID=A0A940YHJ0_9BURK|nr:threonine synthase [Ideonella aquatica]MBQ0957949.1 threonine synthase [Ideonella aquatica]
MSHASQATMRCLRCEARFFTDQIGYSCPHCDLDGALDVEYDYRAIGRGFKDEVLSHPGFDMWRYRALLPVRGAQLPPAHTGGSPLYRLPARGIGRVLVKDDSRNPSGSLKDRASALAVALARDMGVRTVAAASTGNAAAALACMAAGSDLRCVIFAPTSAAREKLAQIRAYGVEVIEVEGGYDEAFAACHAACRDNGWYNRSTGINSYMTEGKKTVAFEIFEQMGWTLPDRVFVPVGNGCIVGAVYKGFDELRRMGLTDRVPHIMGVQAEGSDYMYRAWREGAGPHRAERRPCKTAASSISVALPRDRIKALRAIEDSQGEFLRVSDDEIFTALLELARLSGVFAEPGAAAAYAGAKRYGAHERDETAVVVVTGSGLKDVGGLLRSGALSPASAADLAGAC